MGGQDVLELHQPSQAIWMMRGDENPAHTRSGPVPSDARGTVRVYTYAVVAGSTRDLTFCHPA